MFTANGLENFLRDAVEYLKNEGNCDKAESIAHFLMGMEDQLPNGLSQGDLVLSNDQKTAMRDLLRTHRFGFFGIKENSEKTSAKLTELLKAVCNHNGSNVDLVKKELAPGGFLLNISSTPMIQVPVGSHTVDGKIPTPVESLKKILDTAPAQIKSNPKFAEFEKKAGKYLDYMKPFQGENFAEILAGAGLTFIDLVGSIKAYSNLDSATARQKCMERDLVNLQMRRNLPETNYLLSHPEFEVDGSNFTEELLGVKTSYTERKDAQLDPGSQVSLAMDTVMRREDGRLVKVKTLTVTMPALDNIKQPESKIYTDGNTVEKNSATLKKEEFTKATTTIKEHILSWVNDNLPCKRVVLSAIGAGEFLKLLNNISKNEAQDIIASALADVANELNSQGIAVGFSDLNESFCNRVNQKVTGEKISYLGKLPRDPEKVDTTQDWLEDGDLLLIPGDASSLAGNGGRLDQSFEGFTGRISPMSMQHSLAIMASNLGLDMIV